MSPRRRGSWRLSSSWWTRPRRTTLPPTGGATHPSETRSSEAKRLWSSSCSPAAPRAPSRQTCSGRTTHSTSTRQPPTAISPSSAASSPRARRSTRATTTHAAPSTSPPRRGSWRWFASWWTRPARTILLPTAGATRRSPTQTARSSMQSQTSCACGAHDATDEATPPREAPSREGVSLCCRRRRPRGGGAASGAVARRRGLELWIV
mmetsp:Transcript_40818/g.128132  ORF Transcript_40818/g.128132 Transcript_40818/m.128132 type:complete len:207 (+) Transcript_40818:570-1190(+)